MTTPLAALPIAALLLAVSCEPSTPPAEPDTEPDSARTSAPSTPAEPAPIDQEPIEPAPRPSDPAADAAPAPARQAEPQPDAATEPEGELAGWTRYRHPLGAAFLHPPDWRVQETAMGLLLVPPDLAVDRELIAAFGSSAQGVTDPKDAGVGQMLDMAMAQTMPGLRRSGRPKSVDTKAGAGARYDYRGSAPDGTSVRCRVFVAIANDAAVSFSVVGDRKAFAKRAPVVETIFSTLEDGRGEAPETEPGEVAADIDPQLVGVFRGESLAGGGGTGIYINTQLVYALNADGTALYGAQSHMNASQRDYNGNLKWTADGVSDGNVSKGRWSARNGILTFSWSDGTSGRVAYGFEPDGTLALRDAVTRKLINIYSRVR